MTMTYELMSEKNSLLLLFLLISFLSPFLPLMLLRPLLLLL